MRAILAMLFVLIPYLTVTAADPVSNWKVGVASAVITPPQPIWMAGYAARTKPAEGKAQDLFAKALAIEDNAGSRIVIVTLDLISVPRFLRDRLETAVKDKYNLPAEGLLLNCSHTHCGPEFRRRPANATGEPTERERQAAEYADRLESQLLSLIGSALKDLSPAQLHFHRARCGFAMNRRLPITDGWKNSPNPDGPVDHDVPVLRVVNPKGEQRAILFGYACHNTTLGFYQWCGDYAGFAQEFLERANPGTTALFLAGCGGDQNPYPRGTLELARLHGETLAAAVMAALQTPGKVLSGPLRGAIDLAQVDYARTPTREALQASLAKVKNKYEQGYYERLLRHLDTVGPLPNSYRVPVQVLRFGTDLTLVALPGETVVDYSLRVKRDLKSDRSAVWVAGYSNDVFAYLPSRRVLQEGGYEGGGALIYSSFPHPSPFADTVEDRIVGMVLSLYAKTEYPTTQEK